MTINTNVLDLDPSLWEAHPSYISGLQNLKALHVVNDVAERAVALVKSYSGTVKKEEYLQDLLLVQNVAKQEENEKCLNLGFYAQNKGKS